MQDCEYLKAKCEALAPFANDFDKFSTLRYGGDVQSDAESMKSHKHAAAMATGLIKEMQHMGAIRAHREVKNLYNTDLKYLESVISNYHSDKRRLEHAGYHNRILEAFEVLLTRAQ